MALLMACNGVETECCKWLSAVRNASAIASTAGLGQICWDSLGKRGAATVGFRWLRKMGWRVAVPVGVRKPMRRSTFTLAKCLPNFSLADGRGSVLRMEGGGEVVRGRATGVELDNSALNGEEGMIAELIDWTGSPGRGANVTDFLGFFGPCAPGFFCCVFDLRTEDHGLEMAASTRR